MLVQTTTMKIKNATINKSTNNDDDNNDEYAAHPQ